MMSQTRPDIDIIAFAEVLIMLQSLPDGCQDDSFD